MKRVTLQTHNLQTLSWLGDRLIDWVDSGRQYLLNGEVQELGTWNYGTGFDNAITSDDGVYAVIYQTFGTKGILLKNGKVLRELTRSDYRANIYEYPAAFVKTGNGFTYLIHCPNEYNELEMEEVETGSLLYNLPRKASDFFHSCLEISPDNKTFMSKGWVWQPFSEIELFDIEACFENPLTLDKGVCIDRSKLADDDDVCEIYNAAFINNELMLLEYMDWVDKLQHCIWNLKTNSMEEKLAYDFSIGRYITVIDDTLALDLYQFPKLFNFRTGEILSKMEDINSGGRGSCFKGRANNEVKIAINKKTKQVAIANGNTIEVLSV